MEDINGGGIFVGVMAWILFLILAVSQADCLNYGSCGAGEMISMGFISIGMLAPAWLVSVVASIWFKK